MGILMTFGANHKFHINPPPLSMTLLDRRSQVSDKGR